MNKTSGQHDGFTLIETLFALGLSVTLLGTLFPVYWHVTRGALIAHEQSIGTMLAAQRVEQLRALTFAFRETGSGIDRETDLETDLSGASSSSGGTGLSPSPPGSLVVSTPGYVDYLDSQGHWVGNAASPPEGAAYVRRWAVTPSLSSPDDGVMVQVVVSPIAEEVRGGPRTDGTRRPSDVWLCLFRARVL